MNTTPTFKPLSRGRYRCNQTGHTMSKKEIAGFTARFLNGDIKGDTEERKRDTPTRSTKRRHRSRFAAKHGW